jgi:type II secretory pathway pseudopilin PulG
MMYGSTRSSRRAFTLLETALATAIVGIGIVASMRLFAALTQQNHASNQMTTAMMLTEHIREAMIGLSFNDPGTGRTYFGPEVGETLATYDDVDDFDGSTFNPPINSLRQPVGGLGQFSQVISVWPVYMNNLRTNSNESAPDLPKTSYQGAVRVRVRVLYRATAGDNPAEVYRTSWIRVDN